MIQENLVQSNTSWTARFGSEQDEAEYVAWLKEVQRKMRQPQPYHNSVEEAYEEP